MGAPSRGERGGLPQPRQQHLQAVPKSHLHRAAPLSCSTVLPQRTPHPPESQGCCGCRIPAPSSPHSSPWSGHSPRACGDVFPFKALLLLLLPQPCGVGFQPRGGRGCLLFQGKSTGESGMFHQPPLHQGGVQHLSHLTVPSLPLLPQKKPVMPHKELVKKKNNLVWEDFGSYKDSSSVK